ncbi:MAG: PilN domain-containing protein [Desulfotomaculaceae bacterium]|nr:PilN domain-containing protein [Desulfotomaculaceae bacterium]
MEAYKVNLLPRHLQREGVIDIRKLAVMLAVALPAALILGSYIIFLINYSAVKDELAETKAQAASLAPAAARVDGIIRERTEMEAAIEEFDQILKNHKLWSGLLDDLGNIAPVDLWLTGLEVSARPFNPLTDQQKEPEQKEPDPYASPSLVSCKGMAGTVPSIGIFLRNLNGLPYFAEVKLVKVNAVSEGLEFEIIARIKDEG